MNRLTRREFTILAGGTLLVGPGLQMAAGQDSKKHKVLLITGQNNHDWKRTTPLMKKILEDAGCFEVTVSKSPAAGAKEEEWSTWRPAFGDYQVVFSDYNGEMWPAPVRQDFERYVAKGGRVLIQHAANNPFPGWTAYEKMVGLLWRDNKGGYRVFYDGEDKLQRQPPGEGPGAGHGRLHDWPIKTREPQHPIFKDLPEVWLHAYDELYHTQRGPAENMHMLATAWDDPEVGGTGVHEPQIWWIPYEKGIVLTFLPGHLWAGQEDLRAFHCVGLRTLLQRCCEWLATGKVTLPVPKNFPTAEKVSLIET